MADHLSLSVTYLTSSHFAPLTESQLGAIPSVSFVALPSSILTVDLGICPDLPCLDRGRHKHRPRQKESRKNDAIATPRRRNRKPHVQPLEALSLQIKPKSFHQIVVHSYCVVGI